MSGPRKIDSPEAEPVDLLEMAGRLDWPSGVVPIAGRGARAVRGLAPAPPPGRLPAPAALTL